MYSSYRKWIRLQFDNKLIMTKNESITIYIRLTVVRQNNMPLKNINKEF